MPRTLKVAGPCREREDRLIGQLVPRTSRFLPLKEVELMVPELAIFLEKPEI